MLIIVFESHWYFNWNLPLGSPFCWKRLLDDLNIYPTPHRFNLDQYSTLREQDRVIVHVLAIMYVYLTSALAGY